MSLEVITLTRGTRPEWLRECIRSIDLGDHLVHTCPDDFEAGRWETTYGSKAKYVAWVDDDDRVMPGALAKCVEALEATGAAMAFTDEAHIDANGDRLRLSSNRPRSRRDLAMHPRSVHHLSVFRVAALDPIVRTHAKRIGIGTCWLIRAHAGLVHKAVHVPIVGYEWRMHPGQDTKDIDFADAYARAMPALREVTRLWMGPLDAQIRQFGATT